MGAPDGSPIYKTSSVDMKFALGDEITQIKNNDAINSNKQKIIIPQFKTIENNDSVKIFAKCYSKKYALLVDKSGAERDIL